MEKEITTGDIEALVANIDKQLLLKLLDSLIEEQDNGSTGTKQG